MTGSDGFIKEHHQDWECNNRNIKLAYINVVAVFSRSEIAPLFVLQNNQNVLGA